MARLKRLQSLLQHLSPNNDNLHRIAISNLDDGERKVVRWWCKKYRVPLKPFHEHTMEELIVEMLEDYYSAHPAEIDRFLASLDAEEAGREAWDGTMPKEYESAIQKRLEKFRKVDLSQFQSDEALSPEDEQAILDGIGRNLPKSTKVVVGTNKKGQAKEEEIAALGDGEFEDNFEG